MDARAAPILSPRLSWCRAKSMRAVDDAASRPPRGGTNIVSPALFAASAVNL
jgi:hypothetical protein